ncbi:hypothetical protein GCM10025298_32560 [Natronobiforma cellulositropha]
MLAGLGVGASGTASAGIPTPRLHVDGNLVKDPDGNTVVLRGLNMADPKRLNVTAPARGKNAEQVVDFLTDESQGWYPRIIRVPAQPTDIGEHEPGHSGGPPEPVAFTEAELLEYLETHYDPVVEQLRQRGVYMIVDFHRHWEGLEWDTPALSDEVELFWDVVAERYADRDHVLFEVYNEPTEPGMWGDPTEMEGVAETWREWKETAQPWVDTIREHADNIVLIGSPSWTQSPEGVYIEPFDGENLAYTYHIYAGHPVSGDQAWAEAAGNGEGTDGIYEEVPLFVTEFGWETNNVSHQVLQGQTSDFADPFFEWLESSDGIHWTAWCADPVWRPVMFSRPFIGEDPANPEDVDSIGHVYEDPIPEHCPNLPCEWELLGGEHYAGEYVKAFLEEYKDEDLPGAAYDTVAPPSPPGLEVTSASFTELDLAWEAVDDSGEAGMSHYNVYVDGDHHASVYDGTETTLTGLTAETDYEIAVTAQDRAGNESGESTVSASTESFEDDTPPTPPSSLEVLEVSQSSVTLEWDAAEPGGDAWLTGYRIAVDGAFDHEVGEETTETTVVGLQFETSYEFAVTAVDAAGNESESVTVSATPTSHPDQEPFNGPHTIPGRVDAVDFDQGGEGIAFETEGGGGSGYRDDQAGMEQTPGGGYHLAFIESGDWWEYTVEVEGPGTYEVSVGVASADGFDGGALDVYVNDQVVDSIVFDSTGGWHEFEAVEGGEVDLEAGLNIVRIQTTADEFNFQWFEFDGEPGEIDEPVDLDVSGDGNPAQDLTGDGLYEDITGNGQLGFNDVVTFFEEHNGDVVQNNVDYFDFSGSGSVGFNDVVELFEML